MKSLLSNKLYLSILGLDLLSNLGDTLYYLALMNYVLLLPDTKYALALVSFSETFPILSGIFWGYLADKTSKKVNTIIATQVFRLLLYILVGRVMSFQPALWVVIVAAFVNLLAAMAGQYENGLYIPISLRLVSDQDREMATAFSSSLKSTFSILFNASGAILIGIMSYSQLAYINAATFAVCALLMTRLSPKLNALLNQKPITPDQKQKSFIKGFIGDFKSMVAIMVEIPIIRLCLVIVPCLNALLNGLSTILVLVMSADKGFIFFNSATTIASVSMVLTLGQILGNLLVTTVLKVLGIMKALHGSIYLLLMVYFSMFCHNIAALLISLFLIGITVGIVNPKMYAYLLNTLPEDKMALMSNSLTTYFMLGTFIFNFVLSGLVLILSAQLLVVFCLLLSLLLVGYTLFSSRKKD